MAWPGDHGALTEEVRTFTCIMFTLICIFIMMILYRETGGLLGKNTAGKILTSTY